LDSTVLEVPLVAMFYLLINFLEGIPAEPADKSMEELRLKIIPTLILGLIFWIPVQIINFRFLSPQARVPFIAVCTFIEVNGLCFLKKLDLQYFKS